MKKRTIFILALLILVGSAVAGRALASSGGDYVLDWYTIDAGGGTSSGGDYVLRGTAGQIDAGAMSGGDYALAGGFWTGGIEAFLYDLFLPLIQR
jgi:hypothetical protein